MPLTEGGCDTRPQDASSRDAELVGRVREAGLEISYQYNDEIPFDARTVIEDLLFQLTQRLNEVTHLQRKADSLQKRSRVRKRKESEERECPPMKQREPSGRSESSRNTEASMRELRARTEKWSLAGQDNTQAQVVPPTTTMLPTATTLPSQTVPPAQAGNTRMALAQPFSPAQVEPTWQSGPIAQGAPSAPQGKRSGHARRGNQRMAEQRPAIMINRRPYEGDQDIAPRMTGPRA